MKALCVLAVFVLVAGCGSIDVQNPAHPACLLSSQKPMVMAQLFFGRDVEGRAPVSDAEWSAFVADVVAKEFSDGFTVIDGDGSWRDPQSHATVTEKSKILSLAAPDTPGLAARIDTVMQAYRRRFHQQSVGLVTHTVCAAF
jgi:hypothetical protein